ncbi:hypothetical protein HDU76_012946 [Blyttiomyces sp. JEL0837]|nr:hypothetical protein HDU76_012946 [Blyttiomyces sp. JEL0837]
MKRKSMDDETKKPLSASISLPSSKQPYTVSVPREGLLSASVLKLRHDLNNYLTEALKGPTTTGAVEDIGNDDNDNEPEDDDD